MMPFSEPPWPIVTPLSNGRQSIGCPREAGPECDRRVVTYPGHCRRATKLTCCDRFKAYLLGMKVVGKQAQRPVYELQKNEHANDSDPNLTFACLPKCRLL